MSGKLTVIYSARTVPDAHQLRNLLVGAGIRAVVTNDALNVGIGGEALGWSSLPRVAVAEEDADRARQMALDFEQTIASTPRPLAEEAAEAESPPRRPEAWPRCPQCGELRITSCPICETAGTDFAEADPDFVGTPALDEEAQATPCHCGWRTPPPAPAGVDAADAAWAEERDPRGQAHDHAQRMLICPTCDEAFVPEYPRRCEWCGHEFDDGYEVEGRHEPREPLGPRAIAVIVGLIVLAIAFVVYFSWLF